MFLSKLKKLSAVSKEEILFRLKGKLYQNWEYICHMSNQDQLPDTKFVGHLLNISSYDNLGDELFERFNNGKRDKFFTECYKKDEKMQTIKKHFPCQLWISEADNILDGELTLLGQHIQLKEKGWNIDPLKNIRWPQVFYSKVSGYSEVKLCDIKYIWELNRHQYLIILGKAYWITGEEKYAQKIFEIIQKWITQNPYNSGVNWTSSLELAVRVISWIWAYFLCQNSKYVTPENHKIITKSIYQHGRYIEKHLSYYSSPYNHLIGEAAALNLIGSLFREFKDSTRWEATGWQIMEEQIDKQFHPDGMCVEQASFYHHFTLGFYLQSVLLRRINKKEVSKKVLSCIENALELSMWLMKPDGSLPMLGDIDNARSLYFNSQHSWNFRGFLGIGAILFNRSDFKECSNGLSEEILWLFNDKEIEEFLRMDSEPPMQSSKPFYESGYFVSRASWNDQSHYLCFDCGEIADGLHDNNISSAAHGHADALSFELSAYGKSFLVDGGFYTYFGDHDWHRYFRQEEAHNTVKIKEHRQAVYSGRLTWNHVKRPELEKWISNEKYDAMSAYIKYQNVIQHKREIIYLKNHFWFINDLFITDKIRLTTESYLHFDPSVELKVEEDKKRIIASIDNIVVLIKYFSDVSVYAERGGNTPSSGWIASGYGIKRPAWRIQFNIELESENKYFPVLIIPLLGNADSINFREDETDSVTNVLFKSSFSHSNDYFEIILYSDFNLHIYKNSNLIKT